VNKPGATKENYPRCATNRFLNSNQGDRKCPLRRSVLHAHSILMVVNADGYHRGIRLFNAREFYDAHEVWEDVWRESGGMEKRFLQGLIQAAVAFHHHSTGNLAGAYSLMERGRKNLAACPQEFGGIHVNELLESLAQWRAALARGATTPAHPVIVRVE
jgi:uncharacterized protein